MKHRLVPGHRIVIWIAVLAAFALQPILSTPAEAGCLREWQACGECAQKAFWRAMSRLEPGDALDAWVDAIDCDIDLYHCVALAIHHNYVCAA